MCQTFIKKQTVITKLKLLMHLNLSLVFSPDKTIYDIDWCCVLMTDLHRMMFTIEFSEVQVLMNL